VHFVADHLPGSPTKKLGDDDTSPTTTLGKNASPTQTAGVDDVIKIFIRRSGFSRELQAGHSTTSAISQLKPLLQKI